MGDSLRHALGGLPERYVKYKSVHKRFLRWAERGVWDRLFDDWRRTGRTRT